MGKTKKRRGLSDKINKQKKQNVKKVNPFEIKVNRLKHVTLGKKIMKHDRGTPGVSRSKADKKRKETLLVEYKKREKVGKFTDRRLGENDAQLSLEDKMLKRFAVERLKTHGKPGLFKLNDEEELTHYGQSLSSIEKFENENPSDDDDDDEDQGRIGAQQVGEEHFGGFMKKKTDEETATSWKERMEEMIAKSKKEKYERQHEREETIQMTEEADQEWLALRSLMSSSKKSKEKDEDTAPKSDDYDITVRELQFEVKGKASDRLKTEEELAAEEKERLEKLEVDRLKRMQGVLEEDRNAPKSSHVSADDLNDGFDLGGGNKQFHVSYKDGKMITDEQMDDDNTDDSVDGVESDSDSEDENGEEEDGISDEESNEDRQSDLDSDEEVEEEETPTKSKPTVKRDKKVIVKDLKVRKEMMEKARQELPYTFPAPESYDDFTSLLEGHDMENQVIIIERLRKCHHPSLAEGNKEKLDIIFTHMVDYYCDMAVLKTPNMELMSRITKHLYEMCQLSPLHAGKVFLDQLISRQDGFSEYAKRKGGRGLYPGLDTLMLFKLISLLFPTSDFRHPVVTPAMLFMGQILNQCPVNNLQDVASGLFICSILLEYISKSKRYIPEAINFLRGTLSLASNKEPNKIEKNVLSPFKPVGKNIDLLKVTTKWSDEPRLLEVSSVINCPDLATLNNDKFRISAVYMALRLLQLYSSFYEELAAYSEIFLHIKYMLHKLPVQLYSSTMQETITMLVEDIADKSSKGRDFLVKNKKKPQPLKLFEPKVQESFDGKKKRSGSRDFQEKQRLLHRYKKEMKGALREIRKDTQFLARQQLQETMKKDSERKRKVKEIHAMLANQQGEWNDMKRKKNKMK